MFRHTILLIAASALAFAAEDSRLPDAAQQGDRDAVRLLLSKKADVNLAQGDGATALHWAAFRDDLEMAKSLLAAGADINAKTRDGAITPLFMACQNGSAAMVELLLKAGADANSVKANGTTALMTAAASGGADAVRILLEHGAKPNAKESVHGQTALLFAAGFDRANAARVLLAHGADPNATTEVKRVESIRFDQDGNLVEDKGGAKKAEMDEAAAAKAAADGLKLATERAQSDLDAFARAMQLKSAQFLIARAASKAGDVGYRGPQRSGPEYYGGMTALLYAAREGYLDTARAIVEGGADINRSSGDKYTPLLVSIFNGHFDVAQYLLEKGADPNLPGITGQTPLYATIDVQYSPKAWTPQPIMDQERVKYLDLMKNLLDHGANVNARIGDRSWFRGYGGSRNWVEEAGATALWRAASAIDLPAMKLLVAHGADPKITSTGGDTPLMVAAGMGWAANWNVDAPYDRMDVVKYCLELGNKVTDVDSKGYTVLHAAAYLGDNKLVEYLLSLGADINARSKAGDTVADMANGPTRFGIPHLDTVALLEKAGSANSHNCRSDQCVVLANSAPRADGPPSPSELADKAALNTLAAGLGFSGSEYRPIRPAAAGGRGGRPGGMPPTPKKPSTEPRL